MPWKNPDLARKEPILARKVPDSGAELASNAPRTRYVDLMFRWQFLCSEPLRHCNPLLIKVLNDFWYFKPLLQTLLHNCSKPYLKHYWRNFGNASESSLKIPHCPSCFWTVPPSKVFIVKVLMFIILSERSTGFSVLKLSKLIMSRFQDNCRLH